VPESHRAKAKTNGKTGRRERATEATPPLTTIRA
jgi:hypothetical protein